MHCMGILKPLLILGNDPLCARRPQQVRSGEVAQLFSTEEDTPAMRPSLPVASLS